MIDVVEPVSRRADEEDPFATNSERRRGLVRRRQERIVSEIARNRRGEYRVPTWVMVAAILVILAGWAALVLL